MVITNIKASFPNDIKTIWNIVTSLDNYTWRSDLSKLEIIKSQEQFIEYTKNGYPTTFTITCFRPYQRYEFSMENSKKFLFSKSFFVIKKLQIPLSPHIISLSPIPTLSICSNKI